MARSSITARMGPPAARRVACAREETRAGDECFERRCGRRTRSEALLATIEAHSCNVGSLVGNRAKGVCSRSFIPTSQISTQDRTHAFIPNLNLGQDTRANRTRHTSSSSTRPHAEHRHTKAPTKQTSLTHTHTHLAIPCTKFARWQPWPLAHCTHPHTSTRTRTRPTVQHVERWKPALSLVLVGLFRTRGSEDRCEGPKALRKC